MSEAYKCDRCGEFHGGYPHRRITLHREQYDEESDEVVRERSNEDYCRGCWAAIRRVKAGEVTRGDVL